MKATIIRGDDLIENDYGATKVTNIFDGDEFDVAKIRKTGDDIKVGYNSESDIAYYVIEGEGSCEIDGEVFQIQKGDLVFIPKGTVYKHMKGVSLLAISNPPFDRSKRVYIEK